MESKRFLTGDEIKFILSFIKPLPGLPEDIGQSVADRHYENHAKQLRAIQLVPSKIPEMRKRLERLFFKSQIEPGKSVGALSSSSIGEKNTQSSLSSFHTAGQSKVQLLVGIPRLEELTNVTRDIKTPSMEVHLILPREQITDLSYVKRVAQEIFEYTEMINFIVDYDQQENRNISEDEQVWYNFQRMFRGHSFEDTTWSIRLFFNVTLLYSYNKTLSSLADLIESNYADAHCVPSPDNLGIIDVYINTDNLGDMDTIIGSIKAMRKKGKKKREEDEDDDLVMLIDDDNKEYYFIRDLVIPSILYIPIGGIPEIRKCFYQEGSDGAWYITTKGSNLRTVLSHPMVNVSRTTSNHLWDNFEVFGIDATRTYLKKELDKLISISSRHLDLLINAMTHSGRPQAVSRYGIDRKQVGVLAKVAFEQPFDNFFHSATIAEEEDMTGVSASITVGNPPMLGSGFMGMVDEKTEKLIDDDQEMYNYHQKLMTTLKSEPSALPFNPVKNKPRFVNQKDDPFGGSINNSFGTGIKKSVLNSRIKQSPFVPDMPSYLGSKDKRSDGNVTRIIIRDPPVSQEMTTMGKQHQSVFKVPGGRVVENDDVEMY